MKMNDFNGKEFLATLRGQDFAHAGEEEAIELMFRDVPPDSGRQLLDAGCGRGGTAEYVHSKGWGTVTGIDVDSQSIEYASQTYPRSQFRVCDRCRVDEMFRNAFDVVYIVNAFYAVKDKQAAANSLRTAARAGGALLLFDYVTYQPQVELPGVLSESPSTPEQFCVLLQNAGWRLERSDNLDEQYVRWYRSLLEKFDKQALKQAYTSQMIGPARKKYADLLDALEKKVLGGVLIHASAR